MVALLLSFLLLSSCFGAIAACTSFLLNNSIYPTEQISARSMDFPSIQVGEVYSPQFGFAAVSRGALLPVFAAAGNASNGPSMRTLEFGGMRTELDFYCTPMPMGPDFQELFYLPKHLARDSIGICTDGLNSAGLSLAVQWDEMMGEIGIYKPHGGFLPVLNFVDVPSWILSRFSTVDEVLDALPAPGNSFDIVVNPLFNKIFDTLMGEPVVAHFIITDARGHSAVFEWINNTYASWHWVRNPYGVLTNTPQFPAQLKMLEDLEPKLEAACNEAVHNDYNEPHSKYWDCTGYSKAFFTPGVGESPDRFQRAVLLNRALGGLGKNAQFPDFVPISPNYKNDTNKAALVLADQILRTLTITGNIETGPMSWTQFSVLRDHKNRLYYIRPAAASLYSKYDLADLAGLPPGTIKMMPNLDMLVTDTPFCQEFHPADMNKASKRSLWKSILRSLHRTIGKLLD